MEKVLSNLARFCNQQKLNTYYLPIAVNTFHSQIKEILITGQMPQKSACKRKKKLFFNSTCKQYKHNQFY
jgi:hypothetical protein